MKRSLGTQPNNAACYVNGMRPAYTNDADASLTGRSGNSANRFFGRSDDSHIHTRLGGCGHIERNRRASFLATLFVGCRYRGGSSKDKAVRDELLRDTEHIIG